LADIFLQGALSIINWLHLLATVVWIGGMASNILVLMPSVRETLDPRSAGALMAAAMKRSRILIYSSVSVLLITGVVMTLLNKLYLGLMQLDNSWSQIILVKHIFIAVLIILVIYAFEVLAPKVRLIASKGPSPELAMLQNLQMRMAMIAFVLGVVILLLTGIATSITALG